MRVVFLGTPHWAVPALERLVAEAHPVAAVVTAPDKPVGRGRRPRPTPVKQAALSLGLGPILEPTTLKSRSTREAILTFEPQALVVVAYGKILPGRLLDAPEHGAINVHFSLLPRHRGASPVQHTLLAGDAEAGVTTMVMERGLDTGPILLQQATPVEPREKASQLGERLAGLGAPLLTETLRRLERGRLTPTPQDDGKATEAPLLRREMGLVSWEEPAELLSRRVRAFDPWPPVIATCRKGILRLLEAVPAGSERVSEPPGTVLGRDGDALRIACGGGTVLRLERVQPEGRRPMDGTACLAGRYVGTGERLGDGPAP